MAKERVCRSRDAGVAACAVLIIAAFSTGCENRPKDSDLVTSIQSQMFADVQLKGATLQVSASGGIVTIKGSVPSDAARYEAYKIATQTSGVSKVNDQVTVDDNGTSPPAPVPAPASAEPPTTSPSVSENRSKASHKRALKHSDPIETANNVPPSVADAKDSPLPDAAPAALADPTAEDSPPPPPPPPPQPKQVQVPASTTITVRMIDSVDSSVNKTGEVFHASLDAPIVVENQVIVPKGADIYLRLANASSAGKISGKSELRLELVKLEFQGQSYPLLSSTYEVSGASRGKDTAKKVGVGAVLGAVIGGIAGGGKGAAVGATVGGGAGGVYQGATHGEQVKIASETKLDFQLDQSVTITVL